MRHYLTISAILCPFVLIGCSDDDKEDVRLRVAELTEISHTAGQCPRTDGLYNRREGFTAGVMAFEIQDDENGASIYLVNGATGPEGERLIVDGSIHQGSDDNRPTRYVAGCDNGTLTLRGSIGNERIDMDVTETAGGVVTVRVGDQTIEYERTGESIRQNLDELGREISEGAGEVRERVSDAVDELQGQDPDQIRQQEQQQELEEQQQQQQQQQQREDTLQTEP